MLSQHSIFYATENEFYKKCRDCILKDPNFAWDINKARDQVKNQNYLIITPKKNTNVLFKVETNRDNIKSFYYLEIDVCANKISILDEEYASFELANSDFLFQKKAHVYLNIWNKVCNQPVQRTFSDDVQLKHIISIDNYQIELSLNINRKGEMTYSLIMERTGLKECKKGSVPEHIIQGGNLRNLFNYILLPPKPVPEFTSAMHM